MVLDLRRFFLNLGLTRRPAWHNPAGRMENLSAGRKGDDSFSGSPKEPSLCGASAKAPENGHPGDSLSSKAAVARDADGSPTPWLELGRESRYDAAEVRRRLGPSAGQAELPGDSLFGSPLQEWLDLVRVWDAGLLLWEGCSRSEIELALSISDGPRFWTWSDEFVDLIGRHHAGRVIRIHRRTCEESRQDLGSARGLVLPEGLELSGPWVPGLPGLSAVCLPPDGPGAEECILSKRHSFPGECLQLRIHLGIARAREALARLLLSDVPLRERLEAQWRHADKHLIAEAMEDAVLACIDHPCLFDPNCGKTLPSFLVLIALRRMASLERTECRRRQRLENLAPAEESLDAFPSLFASAPSPAELLIAAEERAEGERTRAGRRELLEGFARGQSPTDRQMLELMLKGERHYAPYAEALGIGDRPELEQREAVGRAKDRIGRRLRRWMLNGPGGGPDRPTA
jgi:hypothetical protein